MIARFMFFYKPGVTVRACVELVRVCLGRLAAERMAEAVGDRGVDLHETGRVVRWSEWLITMCAASCRSCE